MYGGCIKKFYNIKTDTMQNIRLNIIKHIKIPLIIMVRVALTRQEDNITIMVPLAVNVSMEE